jgi:hypothetical protein
MSDVPSWARRGAKVVCVNPSGTPWLKKDAVYTVCGISSSGGTSFLVISELPPECRNGWYIWRFRPLVDDSDEAIQRDVALFTEHLRQHSTTREGADA